MGLLTPDGTSASLEHNPGVEQHGAGQGPAKPRVHTSPIFSIASDPSCQALRHGMGWYGSAQRSWARARPWRTAPSDLQMAVASAVGGWSAMQHRWELLRWCRRPSMGIWRAVKAACCRPPWDLRNSIAWNARQGSSARSATSREQATCTGIWGRPWVVVARASRAAGQWARRVEVARSGSPACEGHAWDFSPLWRRLESSASNLPTSRFWETGDYGTPLGVFCKTANQNYSRLPPLPPTAPRVDGKIPSWTGPCRVARKIAYSLQNQTHCTYVA